MGIVGLFGELQPSSLAENIPDDVTANFNSFKFRRNGHWLKNKLPNVLQVFGRHRISQRDGIAFEDFLTLALVPQEPDAKRHGIAESDGIAFEDILRIALVHQEPDAKGTSFLANGMESLKATASYWRMFNDTSSTSSIRCQGEHVEEACPSTRQGIAESDGITFEDVLTIVLVPQEPDAKRHGMAESDGIAFEDVLTIALAPQEPDAKYPTRSSGESDFSSESSVDRAFEMFLANSGHVFHRRRMAIPNQDSSQSFSSSNSSFPVPWMNPSAPALPDLSNVLLPASNTQTSQTETQVAPSYNFGSSPASAPLAHLDAPAPVPATPQWRVQRPSFERVDPGYSRFSRNPPPFRSPYFSDPHAMDRQRVDIGNASHPYRDPDHSYWSTNSNLAVGGDAQRPEVEEQRSLEVEEMAGGWERVVRFFKRSGIAYKDRPRKILWLASTISKPLLPDIGASPFNKPIPSRRFHSSSPTIAKPCRDWQDSIAFTTTFAYSSLSSPFKFNFGLFSTVSTGEYKLQPPATLLHRQPRYDISTHCPASDDGRHFYAVLVAPDNVSASPTKNGEFVLTQVQILVASNVAYAARSRRLLTQHQRLSSLPLFSF
ncbi:hypothetical protein BKA70DRAFT_1241561 [Coprinopsis sp. MPI-PUGE-AT-0042]|nr:hypothetical protein BKA70DRAFT_1241561 [Coprinopsis sp. MPI-PUGE-AT-0042]